MRRHSHPKTFAKRHVPSLILMCLFSSVAVAQPQKPLDVSGLWVRDDGGVVRFSQDGKKITATHVELSVEVRDVFGFRPGDDHMVGVLQDRALRGKMFRHLPVDWKSRCPEQWAGLTDIELTVAGDGNSIEGRWEWQEVSERDCSFVRKEWRPRRYARVDAAASPSTGRLNVVATGRQLTAVRIELILDASGSMWGRVGGRPKIESAKEAIAKIVENLPEDVEVALRVYGHRVAAGKPGACEDSELQLPFAKIDKRRLIERVRLIRPLGTTPIAYSLRQVARDLGGAPGEKMVILVTDGMEECGGSPSAAVSELLAKGLKVELNIVGFALADDTTKWEVRRVAELGGGHFFDVMDAAGLRAAVEGTLAVPYDVLDATGSRVVGSGRIGQGTIPLTEGSYTVVVRMADSPLTIPNVRVVANKSTRVELDKQGPQIGSRILGP